MRNERNKQKTIELINEYIACANYVCNVLKEFVGDVGSLVGAYRAAGVPKEGYLEGEIYYNFHGAGCYFEMPNTQIDIDFGPDNRCDGFDFYRLNEFKLQRKDKYSELSEFELKQSLENLANDGVIYNPRWLPSDHLFYLKISVNI